MKAGLIVRLIEAHCSGNESLFERAVSELVNDEERKGNSSTAATLKKAYCADRRPMASLSSSPMSTVTYSAQNVASLPRDKDSSLELVDIVQSTVRLSDVALPDKTFGVLSQIVEEQSRADDLLRNGITPTNRVLFCGPPGCGKTLAANALAGELDMPVAYVRLDGLVSSYLGQTGTNIRKIFEYVRNKRIMLFLDEFDAIAKKRDDSHELGELKRVVTTLLQNLDSMPASVFLVAATNHHHLLDAAIWRRFDISIFIDLPNQQQRSTIIRRFLSEHLRGYIVDAIVLTVLTDGMSGAQICSFMQSLAKYCVINAVAPQSVSTEIVADAWLKHRTLFVSKDSEDYTKALAELHNSGVSIRALERVTGIPKSTLSYQLNALSKEERTDEPE